MAVWVYSGLEGKWRWWRPEADTQLACPSRLPQERGESEAQCDMGEVESGV